MAPQRDRRLRIFVGVLGLFMAPMLLALAPAQGSATLGAGPTGARALNDNPRNVGDAETRLATPPSLSTFQLRVLLSQISLLSNVPLSIRCDEGWWAKGNRVTLMTGCNGCRKDGRDFALRMAFQPIVDVHTGQPFAFEALVGVASLCRSITSVDLWLAAADAWLYRAKKDGRNRCRSVSSNGPRDDG